jgi:phosphate transport system permease protein
MNIKKRETIDQALKQVFKATGFLTIALLGGIFLMLLYNSIAFL